MSYVILNRDPAQLFVQYAAAAMRVYYGVAELPWYMAFTFSGESYRMPLLTYFNWY